jgi:hypothetical protein
MNARHAPYFAVRLSANAPFAEPVPHCTPRLPPAAHPAVATAAAAGRDASRRDTYTTWSNGNS